MIPNEKQFSNLENIPRQLDEVGLEYGTANVVRHGMSVQALDQAHKELGIETPISGDALARANFASNFEEIVTPNMHRVLDRKKDAERARQPKNYLKK